MTARPDPKALVLVTRGKILAGAERQMLYLAAGIDRRLFEPHVVTFFDGPVTAEASRLGVPASVVQRRGQQMWQDPSMPVRLARRLGRLRPDVVYAWLLEANVYTTAALLLWPWRRTSLVLSERGTANPRNRVGYRLVASVLARRAQALVANSPAGVSFMRTMGVPEGKLRLVPNGVPTARAAADPARVAALREELRLPARAKLVLNAGRLFAQKDHATLLRAFRQVRQEQPEAVLAIAGAGDLRASLEALTQDLGLGDSVRWLSERDDVPDLLALAELAVLSSADGEGLSNFLIEALLAGRRVVGTDVGSTADIIAGTDGVLVPSRAPECLAEAMVRALSEGDSASAQAARRASAHERFGEDAYVRKSERALMEALGEAPSKDRYV